MSQSLMKELAELQKKANKYDNLRTRYVEHANKLKKIIEMCQELAQEIDPMVGISTGERSGVDFKEIAAEFYDKMLHGTEISSELIAKTYPEWTPKQVLYMMKVLREKYGKKIQKRKEGVKVFYYVQKDI